MTTSQSCERVSVANLLRLQSLLNEYQVAETLAVSVATVRRWRTFGQGPKFLKLGASVRYRPEDLQAWLASRPKGGEKVA